MKVKWLETSKHVTATISLEHRDQMVVHGAFSNPEPSHLSYTPEMMTEYGLKGASVPLIKYVTTWEHNNRKETEKTTHWIAIVIEDES